MGIEAFKDGNSKSYNGGEGELRVVVVEGEASENVSDGTENLDGVNEEADALSLEDGETQEGLKLELLETPREKAATLGLGVEGIDR